MSLRVKILTTLFLFSVSSFAQTETSAVDSSATNLTVKETSSTTPSAFVFKPTIGLGVGMFSFYGDVYDKHFQAPMVSRIAYELNVSQYFTDYLQFNFYALFGKLGANERNTVNARNLNFESQIRVGGVNLLYNFDNFLPQSRTISPFVSLGIESFEFLSKTDLYDKHGYRYYYWSDGTIRNMDQNDPAAFSAIELQRDYTYESDIRTLNLDGFGKYAERSWAVPVGAGAMVKVNDYWTFKIGATMHFTFTDYIDGVSEKSVSNRVGNKKNDNFMMTSFSLNYNLGMKKKEKEFEDGNFDDVDFFALDLYDMDKDGVPDSKDSCQGTPPGIPVDAKGCPLDDDSDGVPNFKDDELNTPMGVFVDERGVQLTDSIIAYRYNYYMDSTGAFAKVEYASHNGGMYGGSTKEYMVSLGTFQKGIPSELMTKFLSVSDISSTNINDSTTIYTAGKFNSLLDAEKRKQQLIADGYPNAKVVYKKDGEFYDAPLYGSVAANTNNSNNTNTNNANSNSANNNNTASNTNSTNNQTNTTTNNSNTTSNSNTTTNNNSTSSTNTTANNTTNNNSTSNTNTTTNNTNNNSAEASIAQSGVVLRVQLGAYSRRLSKSVFRDVPDLIEIKTEDGLYKYMTGSFKTMDQAAKHKVDMLLKGYQGAFITAYKDGKRVTLKEAGATPLNNKEIENNSDSTLVNAVNKKLVVFKIQVGIFKSEPPADKQAVYAKMNNVSKEMTATGLSRYVVGSYNDYGAAQKAKADIAKQYGLEDAFVVAFFNGEYISIQEALELLK